MHLPAAPSAALFAANLPLSEWAEKPPPALALPYFPPPETSAPLTSPPLTAEAFEAPAQGRTLDTHDNTDRDRGKRSSPPPCDPARRNSVSAANPAARKRPDQL